jgi:hypothetical protein
MAACAAFRESRMKLAEPTKFRKSGGAQWRDLQFPPIDRVMA